MPEELPEETKKLPLSVLELPIDHHMAPEFSSRHLTAFSQWNLKTVGDVVENLDKIRTTKGIGKKTFEILQELLLRSGALRRSSKDPKPVVPGSTAKLNVTLAPEVRDKVIRVREILQERLGFQVSLSNAYEYCASRALQELEADTSLINLF